MEQNSIIAWTLLVIENILLITFFLIWLKRKCQTCSKVKCIERVFNKLCQSCQDKENKPQKKFRF